MRKQVIVVCLTLGGLLSGVQTIEAQSSSYDTHHQGTRYHHYVKHDGKKKTLERTGVGAGAGAAAGALIGKGKGAAIGAAAGGVTGYAYDRHKKHQERRDSAQ